MECVTAEEIANAMEQILFHSDITLMLTLLIGVFVGYCIRALSDRPDQI